MAVYLVFKNENGEEDRILFEDFEKQKEQEIKSLQEAGAPEQIFEIWNAYKYSDNSFVCRKLSEEKALTFSQACDKYESKIRTRNEEVFTYWTGGYYDSEERAKKAFDM